MVVYNVRVLQLLLKYPALTIVKQRKKNCMKLISVSPSDPSKKFPALCCVATEPITCTYSAIHPFSETYLSLLQSYINKQMSWRLSNKNFLLMNRTFVPECFVVLLIKHSLLKTAGISASVLVYFMHSFLCLWLKAITCHLCFFFLKHIVVKNNFSLSDRII